MFSEAMFAKKKHKKIVIFYLGAAILTRAKKK